MRDIQSDQKRNRPAREGSAWSRGGEVGIGLPGEHRVDSSLILRAVEDLNRIHLSCALDYCLRIGEYILATFFAGNSREFTKKAREHCSFRSLSSGGKLDFSASYLWTSVAVACQYHQLPSAIADSLPLSHHRLLLSIGDVQVKRQIAGRAIEDGMSKRQLANVVRRHKEDASRRPGPGRPAHPSVLKHLTRLDEALQALVEAPDGEMEIDERFRDRVQVLVERVRDDLGVLDARLDQLQERIGDE